MFNHSFKYILLERVGPSNGGKADGKLSPLDRLRDFLIAAWRSLLTSFKVGLKATIIKRVLRADKTNDPK